MMRVLVVGAGLAGCTVACELAAAGVQVVLVETGDEIGGKVLSYGCKGTDTCNNCGLCLASGLWQKVEQCNIEIYCSTRLVDIQRENEIYSATLKNSGGLIQLDGFAWVVVATGFEPSASEGGYAELAYGSDGIITGSELEAIFRSRADTGLFDIPPKGVAFLQCYGSRDCQQHAQYCSRVCCGYATRAAKVIKHFYPDCRVVFFYMEMQMVAPGDYYQSLVDAGIEFVKCKPVKIAGRGQDDSAGVIYDDPVLGQRVRVSFDWIVLSEGIRPSAQSRQLAEICGLGQDASGFLRDAFYPNVVPIGCATGPKKIEETYTEAVALAKDILVEEALI